MSNTSCTRGNNPSLLGHELQSAHRSNNDSAVGWLGPHVYTARVAMAIEVSPDRESDLAQQASLVGRALLCLPAN
jgi:hypothetical protein